MSCPPDTSAKMEEEIKDHPQASPPTIACNQDNDFTRKFRILLQKTTTKKTPGLSFTFLLMTILISLNSEKIPEHQNRPINRPTDPGIHEKCKINDDFVSVKAL
jgi:hypothetical protein|uniref:Uncharacterized protein n=1 Tax=Zea mays TaxID=4577 RepID=A0A804P1T6_MAIZE